VIRHPGFDRGRLRRRRPRAPVPAPRRALPGPPTHARRHVHDRAGSVPIHDFQVINAELARYAPELANTPQVVVLNKTDATEPRPSSSTRRRSRPRVELLTMSAATGEGPLRARATLVTPGGRQGWVRSENPGDASLKPPGGCYNRCYSKGNVPNVRSAHVREPALSRLGDAGCEQRRRRCCFLRY